MYLVDFDSSTRETLRHLSPLPKSRIKAALRLIAGSPAIGKSLQHPLNGLYSYRVGTLRIIYKINKPKKTIHVITVGPRHSVYVELEKSLPK